MDGGVLRRSRLVRDVDGGFFWILAKDVSKGTTSTNMFISETVITAGPPPLATARVGASRRTALPSSSEITTGLSPARSAYVRRMPVRRSVFGAASAAFLFAACFGIAAFAGELPNVSSLPTGFRYCPAPGADNRDFNGSYYAVDARTGEMTRYMDGAPREEPFGPVDTEEKVLFVAPPISVENRYVPYPGAAPQEPPPEFRESNRERNLHAAARVRRDERQRGGHPAERDRRDRDRHEGKPPWWKKILR